MFSAIAVRQIASRRQPDGAIIPRGCAAFKPWIFSRLVCFVGAIVASHNQ
jgi:hypothetical protein